MLKVKDFATMGMFVVTNTSKKNELITLDAKEYEDVKAYRQINDEDVEYVDKYIDNKDNIIYNALGDSVTIFLSKRADQEYYKQYFN